MLKITTFSYKFHLKFQQKSWKKRFLDIHPSQKERFTLIMEYIPRAPKVNDPSLKERLRWKGKVSSLRSRAVNRTLDRGFSSAYFYWNKKRSFAASLREGWDNATILPSLNTRDGWDNLLTSFRQLPSGLRLRRNPWPRCVRFALARSIEPSARVPKFTLTLETKSEAERLRFLFQGERGIRTLGPVTDSGFRDRPIRPLWHLSEVCII